MCLLSAALALLALLSSGSAHAVTTDTAYAIVFSRSSSGAYSYAVCPTGTFCSSTPGSVFFNNSTARPAGTTTQWMTFRVKSEGYFPRKGHMVVGLRGVIDLSRGGEGLGIILGDVSGRPDGCSNPANSSGSLPPPRAQIESYWYGGNALWPGSCTSFTLQENTWYYVTVHANDNRWVSYQFRDAFGNLLWDSVIQDNVNPSNLAGYKGWFIGHSEQDTGGPWKLRVADFAAGWF